MSVIGRLDRQVDDILISPLSKTREKKEKVPSVEQPGSDPSEAARETDAAENQKTDERRELPVWLL